MRILALGAALLTIVACGSRQASSVAPPQALLRTAPLVTCTADQQKACPAVQVQACSAGQEQVIDYSSDCCAHVTCQPICSSTSPACPTTPAPVCPVGTHLWIGTAAEDCCPAFRCDPDDAKPPAQCASDADCPLGQRCSVSCVGWGCAVAAPTSTVVNGTSGAGASGGGTASSGTAGSDTGTVGACSCPAGDTTCHCDATGSCSGQTCTSQCVEAPPPCDPSKPAACPMSFPSCPGGQQPVVVGTDPMTCCPIQKCSVCPMTASPIACPMIPVCQCATQVGFNSSSCCPSYTCGSVDPATGRCL